MTATCGIAVEAPHDLARPARRQQKRVAAGDDHLPDLRMARDIVEGALERRRRRARLRPARPARGGSRSGNRPGRPGSASAAPGRGSDARCRAPATSARRRSGRPDRRARRSARRRSARIARAIGSAGIGRIDQRRDIFGNRDREPLGTRRNLIEPLRARQGRVRQDQKRAGSCVLSAWAVPHTPLYGNGRFVGGVERRDAHAVVLRP